MRNRARASQTGKRWTALEEDQLRVGFKAGGVEGAIVALAGRRTETACRDHLNKLLLLRVCDNTKMREMEQEYDQSSREILRVVSPLHHA